MFSRRSLRRSEYAADAIMKLDTRLSALEGQAPQGTDLMTWEQFQSLVSNSTDFADFATMINAYDPNAAT